MGEGRRHRRPGEHGGGRFGDVPPRYRQAVDQDIAPFPVQGADIVYALPIAQFGVEASELDYREVYGKGIEEDAPEAYMNRSREKLDAFEVGLTFTAQIIDEIILPGDVRKKIIEALDITRGKVEKLPERAKIHSAPPT